MSELKKAFLGGYRRKAVDTELAELRQKLTEAENDRQRYRHEAEMAENRAAELERAAADWQAKASELEEKLSMLDAMAQPASTPIASATAGDGVFGNIARIYERAYGTGHQIVCDSKETALALLHGLETRFEEIMGASADTIQQYETLHRDVQELYVTLHRRISDVADSTSHMLKQAKDFYGIYDELKEEVVSARDSAATLLEEYDTQAAEFLGTKESSDAPTSTSTAAKETNAAPAAEPPLPYAPADEAPPVAESETESAGELIAAPTEEPVVASTAEPTANKPPIRMVVSAPVGKPSGEFTQFGRKSRISAEDRSELLRKALLRNSGN